MFDNDWPMWDELRELADDISNGRADHELIYQLHCGAHRLSDGTEIVQLYDALVHVDEHRENYHWLLDLDTTSPRWYACLGVAWELITTDGPSQTAVRNAPFKLNVPDLASWIRDEYEDLEDVRSLDLRAIAQLGVRLNEWSWPAALLKSMTPGLVGRDGTRHVSWSGLRGGPTSYDCLLTEMNARLFAEDGSIITLSKDGVLVDFSPVRNGESDVEVTA